MARRYLSDIAVMVRYRRGQRVMPADEMTYHRRAFTTVQGTQHFLDRLVVGRNAFVLAQVLQPGRGHEILQMDARAGHIFDHAPHHRTVAAPDLSLIHI